MLHGARALPPEEADEKLRDFLESISSPVPESERLAEASESVQELRPVSEMTASQLMTFGNTRLKAC
jgi:hypothetical protein